MGRQHLRKETEKVWFILSRVKTKGCVPLVGSSSGQAAASASNMPGGIVIKPFFYGSAPPQLLSRRLLEGRRRSRGRKGTKAGEFWQSYYTAIIIFHCPQESSNHQLPYLSVHPRQRFLPHLSLFLLLFCEYSFIGCGMERDLPSWSTLVKRG